MYCECSNVLGKLLPWLLYDGFHVRVLEAITSRLRMRAAVDDVALIRHQIAAPLMQRSWFRVMKFTRSATDVHMYDFRA